jgi:hypothetical protein
VRTRIYLPVLAALAGGYGLGLFGGWAAFSDRASTSQKECTLTIVSRAVDTNGSVETRLEPLHVRCGERLMRP